MKILSRKVMSDEITPYIKEQTIDAINKIKALKLTRFGKLHLSRFPSQAILEAERYIILKKEQIKKLSSKVDVFSCFEKICKRICKKRNMEINNTILEQAYLLGSINGSEDMLEENRIFTNYERFKYESRTVYKCLPEQCYPELLEQREEYIQKLNESAPKHIALMDMEDVHYTMIKNQIERLTRQIEALGKE